MSNGWIVLSKESIPIIKTFTIYLSQCISSLYFLHLPFSSLQGFIPKFCPPILQGALYLHLFRVSLLILSHQLSLKELFLQLLHMRIQNSDICYKKDLKLTKILNRNSRLGRNHFTSKCHIQFFFLHLCIILVFYSGRSQKTNQRWLLFLILTSHKWKLMRLNGQELVGWKG